MPFVLDIQGEAHIIQNVDVRDLTARLYHEQELIYKTGVPLTLV